MTTPVIDADTVHHAFDRLRDAMCDVHDASAEEANRKRALDTRRVELLESGGIDGKNAETREAQVKARTLAEQLNLDEAQARVRRADLALRAAQVEVDRCKTLLKLLEVTHP